MLTISATLAKQNFGQCLMNVAGSPILIEKSGNPAAVLISCDEYKRLLAIEDKMLLMDAIEAASEGFLSENESEEWFDKMNNRFMKDSDDEG